MRAVKVNPPSIPNPPGESGPGVLPEPAVGAILREEGRLGVVVLEFLFIAVALQLWNVRSGSSYKRSSNQANLGVIACDN